MHGSGTASASGHAGGIASTSSLSTPTTIDGGSSGSGSADGAAASLPAGLVHVLQLCQHRMNLLHSGQVLQQLRGQSGHRAGGVEAAHGAGPRPGPANLWRPNMAALHSLAKRLPDESTARWVGALGGEGPMPVATAVGPGCLLAGRDALVAVAQWMGKPYGKLVTFVGNVAGVLLQAQVKQPWTSYVMHVHLL